MITTIQADKRHYTDFGWLKTYWLFSFSSYYDPGNIQHGALRVFNDDIVAPHTGFGTHPHEEMEIISIVLDGEMVHKDTMGNTCTIRKNDVQRMTAGTGLFHSEHNESDAPVHFIQIWIHPDTVGLTPSYDQKSFSPAAWTNRLCLLAASENSGDAVSLNTDARIYRSSLESGEKLNYATSPARNLFVYILGGTVSINTDHFSSGDQARISDASTVEFNTNESTDLILIDVP